MNNIKGDYISLNCNLISNNILKINVSSNSKILEFDYKIISLDNPNNCTVLYQGSVKNSTALVEISECNYFITVLVKTENNSFEFYRLFNNDSEKETKEIVEENKEVVEENEEVVVENEEVVEENEEGVLVEEPELPGVEYPCGHSFYGLIDGSIEYCSCFAKFNSDEPINTPKRKLKVGGYSDEHTYLLNKLNYSYKKVPYYDLSKDPLDDSPSVKYLPIYSDLTEPINKPNREPTCDSELYPSFKGTETVSISESDSKFLTHPLFPETTENIKTPEKVDEIKNVCDSFKKAKSDNNSTFLIFKSTYDNGIDKELKKYLMSPELFFEELEKDSCIDIIKVVKNLVENPPPRLSESLYTINYLSVYSLYKSTIISNKDKPSDFFTDTAEIESMGIEINEECVDFELYDVLEIFNDDKDSLKLVLNSLGFSKLISLCDDNAPLIGSFLISKGYHFKSTTDDEYDCLNDMEDTLVYDK